MPVVLAYCYMMELGTNEQPYTHIEGTDREMGRWPMIMPMGDVIDLVEKNILLYFSAHWCPSCCAFLPKLMDAYHKIKAKDDAFEVIFIPSDREQASFDEFFSGMPWLALPFGDPMKASLSRTMIWICDCSWFMLKALIEGQRKTKNTFDSGESRDDEKKEHRSCSSLRTGCEAMLRVMKNNKLQKLAVKGFDNNHSHGIISPKSVPYLQCHKKNVYCY
ncbi:putative nucleoredoxin 1 [Quercus suber]|uniref:protein-disulfide reductase n=1 Tax=Quercus suber TaxID=58331 RepID=A0AAW0LX94_QUESU